MLDVARAVDPTALETARTNLIRRTGTAAGAADTFSLAETAVPSETAPARNVRAVKEPDSLQRFEAMVLQTFLQNMMPKETAAVYGQGMAGDDVQRDTGENGDDPERGVHAQKQQEAQEIPGHRREEAIAVHV